MCKAKFRLVSPLRVDCLFQPGIEFREVEATFKFWDSVAAEVDAEHIRKLPSDTGFQYESTQSIEIPNDISVMKKRVEIERECLHGIDNELSLESVEWSLCDFGILLVEISLGLNLDQRQPGSVEQTVQQAASWVNREIIFREYEELRNAILGKDRYEEFVVFDGGKKIENAWASRAFIFDPSDKEHLSAQTDFAREWVGGSGDKRQIVEKLARGEINHYAEWMNYIYVKETASNATELRESWKALLRAQFFYSAMGRSDTKLMDILSWAMSRSEDISTTKLRDQLRREMDFAEALFLKKSEVGKYVNPSSRKETERILEGWDFEDVLEKPVEAKLQICQTRLDNIDSERARSAGFITDLILMVIGVTSILGTMLAVVSLGRGTSSDPNQTIYDFGAGDVTTWIATQPVDVILIISTMVSLIMIMAFVVARKKSET